MRRAHGPRPVPRAIRGGWDWFALSQAGRAWRGWIPLSAANPSRLRRGASRRSLKGAWQARALTYHSSCEICSQIRNRQEDVFALLHDRVNTPWTVFAPAIIMNARTPRRNIVEAVTRCHSAAFSGRLGGEGQYRSCRGWVMAAWRRLFMAAIQLGAGFGCPCRSPQTNSAGAGNSPSIPLGGRRGCRRYARPPHPRSGRSMVSVGAIVPTIPGMLRVGEPSPARGARIARPPGPKRLAFRRSAAAGFGIG